MSYSVIKMKLKTPEFIKTKIIKRQIFIICILSMLIVLIISNVIFSSDRNLKESKLLLIQKISLKNKLIYLLSNLNSFSGEKGDIWIIDPSNIKNKQQLTNVSDIISFSISYDLTKIVLVRNFKKLYMIDLLTGKENFLTDIDVETKIGAELMHPISIFDHSAPSISPTNDKIVFISKSKRDRVNHIWMIDVATKEKVDLTENSPTQYSYPKWSPDGRKISFISKNGKKNEFMIFIMNIATAGKNIVEVTEGFYSEWLDSKTLIIASGMDMRYRFIFYNIEKLKKIKEFKLPPGFTTKFSFAPPNYFYYEDESKSPITDISRMDIINLKNEIIIKNAKNPIFGK